MLTFTSLYKTNGDLLLINNTDNTSKLLINNPNIKIICNSGYHLVIYITLNINYSSQDKQIYHGQSGDLFVFGYNEYGQLGLNDKKYRYEPTLLMNDTNTKIICCGLHHTMIYKNNGDLLVFGCNISGQLD